MSQIWYNDMSYKDRDDCGKRLLCELNAKARFFFTTKPILKNVISSSLYLHFLISFYTHMILWDLKNKALDHST